MQQYHIDTKKITLENFKYRIENKYLYPGRLVLRTNLDENFEKLERLNIKNLDELIRCLKNKKQLNEIAKNTEINLNYLIILRREALSYLTKPLPLCELHTSKIEVIEKLESENIKNTKQLFPKIIANESRKHLCKKVNISEKDLMEVVKFCDLVRINGIGGTFAKCLYETGIDTAEKFLHSSPDEILEKFQFFNSEKEYTKVTLKSDDIKSLQERNEDLPLIIEY